MDIPHLNLPPPPCNLGGPVKCWSEPVSLLTYEPVVPQKNPMFLEKRVYQGSSGRVYPLPFVERVLQSGTPRMWAAVHIENEYLRLMILPDLGGRIHVGIDKTNSYDFFYRQNVIKPALVGLAGPWISGGVEFNWPQHHRPATYMPTDVEIERKSDGSVTIWCSDHDPLDRLKAAHGICLYPGKSMIELKVRLYNRTPFTQTFLWWANVAVHANENYQSFFPPDVHFVADHARRAISEYPLSQGSYYGVDYASRAKNGVPADELPPKFRPRADVVPNDLSWYANIPVPTSYMAIGSKEDFLGGYDHGRQAGLVHVANHHIAPGKKQWTWGNSEFGYAWDRNLTDGDGPYIELMAGVYTDNQPDFSFLAPWETKTFQQYWYPIQKIGIPCKANQKAALSLAFNTGIATIRMCATEEYRGASVHLLQEGKPIATKQVDLRPATPVELHFEIQANFSQHQTRLQVCASDGSEIISYAPTTNETTKPVLPETATEPLSPEEMDTVDELFLTGLHLWQYRHATRSPEPYWREALHRDPGDSQTNIALGVWQLWRGEFAVAERHFRSAVARLTRRNPNPQTGQAFYHLGLALRYQGCDSDAYDAYYKSVWNFETRAPAYLALAELDCKEGRWGLAWEHLQVALRANADNTNARNLAAVTLQISGRQADASQWTDQTLAEDPTDIWAKYLRTGKIPENRQLALDLVFDYARAGIFSEAIKILESYATAAHDGTEPIRCYALAFFHASCSGASDEISGMWRHAAQQVCPDYCFPNRLEEMTILEWAADVDITDARARYLLGTFLSGRKRYAEAIEMWAASAALEPAFATVWRNLGIAYFNERHDTACARDAFEKAWTLDTTDGRVFYERDQLWKRMGVDPHQRLAEMMAYKNLVADRDDLAVELSALHQLTKGYRDSLDLLRSRRFQPWEGGEGLALTQHVRAHVALGRIALSNADATTAKRHFEAALSSPENLGEAKHPLANYAHVYYWLGVAHDESGEAAEAQRCWRFASSTAQDFQEMAVKTHSEMSYYRALALRKLDRHQEAESLLHDLRDYADRLAKTDPKIDYFATSLPAMLLFEEDLPRKNQFAATFFSAQALVGLGAQEQGVELLESILRIDPNHALASDFLAEIEITALLHSGDVKTR